MLSPNNESGTLSVAGTVNLSGDITGGTAEVPTDADSLADEADTVDS